MKIQYRVICILVGLFILSLLAGCGGGGSGSVTSSVSGVVVDEDGSRLEGVKISVTGGTVGSIVTANDGLFLLEGLMGDCRLTSSHDDYDFSPEWIDVTKASIDLKFVGPRNLSIILLLRGAQVGERTSKGLS